MLPVEEKYIKDAKFHALVNFMINQVKEYRYTTPEMIEAVVFACVKVEMTRTFKDTIASKIPVKIKKLINELLN